MHSSQRFSLDPVLEVAVELASEVATPAAVDVGAAKLETAPKGPVSNDNLVNLVGIWKEMHTLRTPFYISSCLLSLPIYKMINLS